MLKNKWFYSSIFIILFPIFLFVNLQNNTENSSNQSTNLDEVSNQEMEKVIELNPDIMPMRIALANRYFEAFDYSSALPHFMYVAENSNDIDLKSLSLSQIGWMVYESGDINTSLNYINEALRISPKSLLAETYKGIILIQQIDTRDEGILILNSLRNNPSLSEEDLSIIEEILKFMKVRFVLLLFLIISCSVDTEDSKIEIDQSIFNNLITLETNESLTIDTSNYVIINYWASWCLECIEEHQYLIELSKTRGLTDKVILVSFQDSIENSIDFLNEYGRGDIIYAIDTESKLAIYSGVFGVPETHIILNNKIVKKYIGPLSLSDLEEIINSYSNE